MRERWSLLTNAKRWWWGWLRWTHFFNDEWLEKKNDLVIYPCTVEI